MNIRQFEPKDTDEAVNLWMRCGLTVPWNNPRQDIERKLRVSPDLFLVGEEGGKIIATAMGGYEGHRGWVNYLAVHPDFQRHGFGTMLMQALEDRLKGLGCPKLNLQVRTTNLAVISFYKSIGYADDNVVSLGKRLIEDKRF
jgi:ribosomal protein S18 acetylase RimI-like enzyme